MRVVTVVVQLLVLGEQLIEVLQLVEVVMKLVQLRAASGQTL
jgi:hypothetical protein